MQLWTALCACQQRLYVHLQILKPFPAMENELVKQVALVETEIECI